jgi:hypothetical protein
MTLVYACIRFALPPYEYGLPTGRIGVIVGDVEGEEEGERVLQQRDGKYREKGLDNDQKSTCAICS